MRKDKSRIMVLVVALFVLLSGCGAKNNINSQKNTSQTNEASTNSKKGTSEQGPGSVKIQYNLSKIPKLASNQLAVWIEDEKGNYVRSIYATKFVATGGYSERQQALPEWIKKSNWKNASKSEVDSVSGATQKPGVIDLTWDCTDKNGKAVKPGKYFYFVEGNIYWENRVIWKGQIEVGNNRSESTARAEYVPKNAKSQGDLIENVSAVFTPKN